MAIAIWKKEGIERRRNAVKQSVSLWGDKAKIDAVYLKCDLLNLFSDNRFTVDHIVPIQNDTVCGLHNEFNLQILTVEENSSKHNNFVAGVQPPDIGSPSTFAIEKKLLEFNLALRVFSNIDVCIEFLAYIRWGKEVRCIRCESDNLHFLNTRKTWQCKKCRRQFTIITGTCLEGSNLAVNKWVLGLWLIANYPKVTGRQLLRFLSLTPRSSGTIKGVALSKDKFVSKVMHELKALKLSSTG